MNDLERSPDDELLNLYISGDRGAFAHLSERHLVSLYDLAVRTTLDGGLAGTAVAGGLEKAAADAAEWPGATTVHAWLLGLVRTKSLEALKPRGRQNGAGPAFDPMDPRFYTLEQPQTDEDLASWAWEAIRAQRPRDYTLLDLMVRRELTPEEIADVADLPRSSVFGTLGRLRGAVEETYAITVLFYRGRSNCRVLDDLSGDAAELSVPLRRDLSRHLALCRDCREFSDRYGSPAALFAAFLPVEPETPLLNAIASVEDEEPGPDSAQAALPLDLAMAGVAAAAGAAVLEEASETSTTTAPAEEMPSLAWGSPAGEEVPPVAAIDDEQLEDTNMEEPPDSDEPELPATDEPAPETEPRIARFDSPSGRRERLLRLEREALMESGSRGGSRGGGGGDDKPPSSPLDRIGGWFGDSPSKRILFLVFAALTVLAAYLGYAIGDSIEGGGDSDGTSTATVVAGAGDLPTRTPGLRDVACGTTPVELQARTRTRLTLAPAALVGYEIAGEATIVTLSSGANARSIDVQPEQGLSVIVEILAVSAPGATDEYRIELTLEKEGSADAAASCLVNAVSQAAPSATSTAPATTPGAATPGPTATLVPTTVPVQPTQPPSQPSQPTAAPPPPTPAGPTATPTRDPNSFIPTWTPTATPVSPTPTPTYTPVPN